MPLKEYYPGHIWMICLFVFTAHQILQKGLGVPIPFIDNYLDPLLCMPIFLGFLWAERKILMRKHYWNRFSTSEVMVMTLVLSLIFEEVFPRWNEQLIKDHWDYIAYAIGALIYYFFINPNTNT